jgi:energy-coupling factor transporter transmembrane protein EcfT
MRTLRLVGVLLLAAAAAAAALIPDPHWLLIAVLLGLLLRAVAWRSFRSSLRATVPIVLFAGILALMQWVSSTPVSLLPLKTIAVFLFSTTALRILPGSQIIAAARPGSAFFELVLFALFVRHFAAILVKESERVLQARSLRVSRPWGRGSFRSLVAAVAALLGRSLVRAERFYAAQLLRGLAE